MDFNSLPDHIFLQIFRHLPFEERVRAGGVNSTFRRISKLAIIETKSLDFSEDRDRPPRFTPAVLSNLREFVVCANNLERIRFNSRGHNCGFAYRHELRLVEQFVNNHRHCPNLKEFHCTAVGDSKMEIVRQIFGNPHLETFSTERRLIFPNTAPGGGTAVSFDRLETLNCRCDDESLESLTGRVPNLKHFQVAWKGKSLKTLDQFLGAAPNLESLSITATEARGGAYLKIGDPVMESFWLLNSLRVLEIHDENVVDAHGAVVSACEIDDAVLRKMVEAFPRLRSLILTRINFTATERGVIALSALEDFQDFQLEPTDYDSELVKGSFVHLSGCARLRKLTLRGYDYNFDPVRVPAATITTLFRNCRQFRLIELCELVDDIKSVDQIISFIQDLGGIGKLEKT